MDLGENLLGKNLLLKNILDLLGIFFGTHLEFKGSPVGTAVFIFYRAGSE